MPMVLVALMAAGMLPLSLAMWANRGTSLLHALVWTAIAWFCWGLAFVCDGPDQALQPGRPIALCLTGCAGVAVLGARRPQVFAWNFVVLGLFTVMMLPMIETQIIGTPPVEGLRIFFMGGTIAVGVLNYLPTRLGSVAFLVVVIMGAEILLLNDPTWFVHVRIGFDLLLTTAPWLAWFCLYTRRRADQSDFDRLWLRFRDRWGLVWSQRVREQFNNAAQHAGWPVQLRWRGLAQGGGAPADQKKYLETLRATMQRFVEAD